MKTRATGVAQAIVECACVLTLVSLCACVYSKADHPSACKVAKDCASNEMCMQSYCIPKPKSDAKTDGGSAQVDAGRKASDAGKTSMDSGSTDAATKDAGKPKDSGTPSGTACVSGEPPEDCYEGPAGTSGIGVCKSGQRACVGGVFTQCLGQVLPSDESCNGKDDNCDGTVDEIVMGDCETVMPGACKVGHLMCRGAFAVCEVSNPPVEETCNGADDDCDGKTDEVASTTCYPPNTDGCTIGNDGTVNCVGLCHAGMTECKNGKSSCTGAVTPTSEVCTTTGLAADENCNSQIDEGCNCTDLATRPCYAGQMGTETHAPCHTGTQTCSGNAWGACVGQVLPMPPETCQNQGVDDDCNGTVDDVPTLGSACIDDTQKGICRDGTYQCANSSSATPVCVTTQAMHELCDDIDQDCDGDPYNGFDLTSDPANCGKCGNACASGDVCCDGMCTSPKNFDSDPQNCGKCGNLCGHSQYCCQGDCLTDTGGGTGGKGGIILPPSGGVCACTTACGKLSCCGTTCVDLTTDEKNCLACGNVCPSGDVCCGSRGCVASTSCIIRL